MKLVILWGTFLLSLQFAVVLSSVRGDVGNSAEASDRDFTSKAVFGFEDLNFGVIVYNSYFKIYRSAGFGKLGFQPLKQHLESKFLEIPKKVLYLNYFGFKPGFPHSWLATKIMVSEGVQRISDFARKSVGTPIYSYKNFAFDEDAMATKDREFEFVYGGNRNVYLIGHNPLVGRNEPMLFKDSSGKEVRRRGNREALYEVLKEVLTAPYAVLTHCKRGYHRTGMLALMIRYLQGGNWIESMGADYGNDKVTNLAEYEYSLHNPNQLRSENLRAIRQLAQDERFKCIRDRYSCFLNSSKATRIATVPNVSPSNRECGEFNREVLWQSCDYLKPETLLATQLDDLTGALEKQISSPLLTSQFSEKRRALSSAYLDVMRNIELFEVSDPNTTKTLRDSFTSRLLHLWHEHPNKLDLMMDAHRQSRP